MVSTPLVAVANSDENTNQQYYVELPAQSVAKSLNHLAQQTGAQFLFSYQLATSKASQPLKGHFTLTEALQQLLQGTGLQSDLVDGVLTVSTAE